MGDPRVERAPASDAETPHPAAGREPHVRSRREWIAAAAIIVAGAVLRLHALADMEFKADEAVGLALGIDVLQRRPWSTGAPWPTAGMLSSAGIPNAPLFNYVMALLWVIARDPVGATAVVALVNVAALVPLYLWVRRRLEPARAAIVLAFAALSPFAVQYSRKIWSNELLLPGLVCVLWALDAIRDAKTWRGAVLLLLGGLWISQLHQSGPIALAALLPVAAIDLWHRRRHGQRLRPRIPGLAEGAGVLLALGLWALLWIPYLTHLASLPSEILADRPHLAWPEPQLLRDLARQVVPVDWLYFFSGHQSAFFGEGAPGLTWLLRVGGFWAAAVLSAPLAILGAIGWARASCRLGIAGPWWMAIIVAFALLRIPSYPHYVMILAPLPALLLGGAFDPPLPPRVLGVRPWIDRSRWALAVAFACSTVGTQLWISQRGGAAGDYGVAYSVRAAQADALVSLFRGTAPPAHPSQIVAPQGVPLACHLVPPEVHWLMRWKLGGDASHDAPVAAVDAILCDGWLADENGVARYRWSLAVPVGR